MSTTKHTPEPWKIERRLIPREFGSRTLIASEDGSIIAEMGPCAIEHNAPRMIECVNACAGIENPIEAIHDARQALIRMRDAGLLTATGNRALAALGVK